ncbi:polysaccharide pyruvyl transferase family protein [Ureibacillus manganicus]|uniref:Polysaccharide pyruvyl transferase domain-containing protein n=1 Tax=Ureibacillus manganicus DSM 26584 TaxID=1384049 RepID=A0A0A3I199_9BACL|nr:polysaccharide pyruvyl transferase family protein [Ureibacillus manganicus]KGR76413.1 hypothetical protein CD29_16955 [Ureibacillus manganicus DSM 26584]
MKNVAIITLNGYFNYGNRLQNYALQEVIKKLDYDVETILHHELHLSSNENKMTRIVKRIVRNINPTNFKKMISIKLTASKRKNANNNRIMAFKQFTEKYINETSYSITSDTSLDFLDSQYDFFVVGSDQIWNPFYHQHEKIVPAIEYLTFAPKEKRLSYAASFGINEIPENYIDRVKNGLSGMKSILVREQAGVEIVKKLTGKDAQLVLDPTMLLTKEKWLSIAEENKNKPKKKFLLTYFLGEMSPETVNFIEKISIENNLEIIQLENYKYTELYNASPSHFVDFINSASIFLTDSFHGVVFSILLETPFIVFKRHENGPSMYSRIETLLQTFKLENRQINYLIKKPTEWMYLDFSETREVLLEEREKSLSIFKNSFFY